MSGSTVSRPTGRGLAYTALGLGIATAWVTVWGVLVASAATGKAVLAISAFILVLVGGLALATVIVGVLALRRSEARGAAAAGLILIAVTLVGLLIAVLTGAI
ncbi:MAG: hypothetical protein KDB60_05635 [Propionibacteriaceae bacterium]|nr:hypothetical protein [Propionibacteriaceae bacterium]